MLYSNPEKFDIIDILSMRDSQRARYLTTDSTQSFDYGEGLNLPNYNKHRDHDIRLESAFCAVKGLLEIELYPAHKKKLLSDCIWIITEVDGKYKTRFRSEGAINESNQKNLRHEHVFERQFIVDELLSNPSDYEKILLQAVACVVTKEEHERLTSATNKDKNLQGWDRYKFTNIKVFDLLEQIEYKV
jgi:hypothetical protein